MKRFLLSPQAGHDLDEIIVFLALQKSREADSEARKLQQGLESIAINPYLGTLQSELTRRLGREVRSRLAGAYRLFYFQTGRAPEVLALLHTSRDIDAILDARFQ